LEAAVPDGEQRRWEEKKFWTQPQPTKSNFGFRSCNHKQHIKGLIHLTATPKKHDEGTLNPFKRERRDLTARCEPSWRLLAGSWSPLLQAMADGARAIRGVSLVLPLSQSTTTLLVLPHDNDGWKQGRTSLWWETLQDEPAAACYPSTAW
jgi:hypothetical protein